MMADAALSTLIGGVEEAFDPTVLFRRVVGEPDDWQVEYLQSADRMTMLCIIRQGGKTTSTGCLVAHTLAYQPGSTIVWTCPAERQAREGLRNVLAFKDALGIAAVRSTMTELELENGSRLVCVPSTSDTIRGFANLALIVMDEAAFFLDGQGGHSIFTALVPALSSTGRVVMASTPNGQNNAFAEFWQGGGHDIRRIHVPAWRIPRMAEKVAFARQHLPKARFEVEYGLKFAGSGSPFFDPEAVAAAFNPERLALTL